MLDIQHNTNSPEPQQFSFSNGFRRGCSLSFAVMLVLLSSGCEDSLPADAIKTLSGDVLGGACAEAIKTERGTYYSITNQTNNQCQAGGFFVEMKEMPDGRTAPVLNGEELQCAIWNLSIYTNGKSPSCPGFSDWDQLLGY